MKKRELIVGAVALAGTVSGMVSMEAAYAALSCKAGSASTAMTCSGASGDANSYLAQALTFTGSNGVDMKVEDSTAGVALCGWHITGRNTYGISTLGGSMESMAGTGEKAASLASSGCN